MGLIETLAVSRKAHPGPDDLDVITHSGGEVDAWYGPDDLDVVTKSGHEADAWYGPDDLEVVTRASGEIDGWSRVRLADPNPQPDDLDTITFSEECDAWS